MISTLIPLTLIFCFTWGDTKVWQWSNSFEKSEHWMDGRIPCPGQAVNIPAEVVYMPKMMQLGKINLAHG